MGHKLTKAWQVAPAPGLETIERQLVGFSELTLPQEASDTSVGMSISNLLAEFLKEKRLLGETIIAAMLRY